MQRSGFGRAAASRTAFCSFARAPGHPTTLPWQRKAESAARRNVDVTSRDPGLQARPPSPPTGPLPPVRPPARPSSRSAVGRSDSGLRAVCGRSAGSLAPVREASAPDPRTVRGRSADGLGAVCGRSGSGLYRVRTRLAAEALAVFFRAARSRGPGAYGRGPGAGQGFFRPAP